MNEIEQKEIEEMARIIKTANEISCVRTCDNCEYYEDDIKCISFGQAIALYNAGYQNCKDKVVLSKEEYSDYLILQKNHEFIREEAKRLQADNERLYKNIGKFKEIVSKETAEKLIKFVSEHCDNETIIWQLDEFVAKQFGVEIKE